MLLQIVSSENLPTLGPLCRISEDFPPLDIHPFLRLRYRSSTSTVLPLIALYGEEGALAVSSAVAT